MDFTQEQQAAIDAMIAERLATETEGLKKSQQQLLKEKKEAASRAALFDGLDPDAAKAALAELADLKQKQAADKAGITSEALTKMRLELRGELEKEFGPKLKELDSLRSENRGLKLDTVVKKEMASAGVRAERIDSLFRLSSDQFDLTNDGQPMVKTGKEVGKYITEDLLQQYPEFFNGSGSSGGGASKSTGGAGGTTGVRVIPAGDASAFIANVEDIANGKAFVR